MRIIERGKTVVAISTNHDVIVNTPESALDLLANLNHEGCSNFILYKENLTEDFFDLKTRVAGEILQKLVNYGIRLAIVGDFSIYRSKSFQDFMYESNKGNHVFFVGSEDEALRVLTR